MTDLRLAHVAVEALVVQTVTVELQVAHVAVEALVAGATFPAGPTTSVTVSLNLALSVSSTDEETPAADAPALVADAPDADHVPVERVSLEFDVPTEVEGVPQDWEANW